MTITARIRARFARQRHTAAAADVQPDRTLTGVQLITQERRRQIAIEGHTAENDRGHQLELLRAGYSYALIAASQVSNPKLSWSSINIPPQMWPWDRKHWKPNADIRRNAIKAGALIAAAIDALPAPEGANQ